MPTGGSELARLTPIPHEYASQHLFFKLIFARQSGKGVTVFIFFKT